MRPFTRCLIVDLEVVAQELVAIDVHRPKLPQVELTSEPSYTPLAVQNRARGAETDNTSDYQEEWQQTRQERRDDKEIQQPLYQPIMNATRRQSMDGERDLFPLCSIPHGGALLMLGRIENIRALMQKSGDGGDLRSYP
jgi:hypothetical protein